MHTCRRLLTMWIKYHDNNRILLYYDFKNDFRFIRTVWCTHLYGILYFRFLFSIFISIFFYILLNFVCDFHTQKQYYLSHSAIKCIMLWIFYILFQWFQDCVVFVFVFVLVLLNLFTIVFTVQFIWLLVFDFYLPKIQFNRWLCARNGNGNGIIELHLKINKTVQQNCLTIILCE